MSNISGNLLKKRLLLSCVIFFAILAVLQYVLVSLPLFKDLIHAEHNNLMNSCETRAMVLSQWYEKIEEITKQIASRSTIRKKLLDYYKGEVTLKDIQNISTVRLNDAILYSEKVVGVKRTASDEKIIAECGIKIPNDKIIYTSYSDQKVNFSFPVKIGDNYLVRTKRAIKNIENQIIGFDEITFKLNDLLGVFTNLKAIGSRSSVVLFYRKGDTLKFPFPLKPNMWNREFLRLVEYEEVRKEVLSDSCYVADNVVITNSTFADNSWGIFIVQDKKERYSSVWGRMIRSIIVVLLLVVIMILVLYKQLSPLTSSFLLLAEDLQQKVDDKVNELKQSEKELDTMKGLLPICSKCKKIRDDKGCWNQLEKYISDHSETKFSHSMCPECYQKEHNK